MSALPFGIDGDRNAIHYGQFYWAIYLPDERPVMCWCDRVEVTAAGALLMWRESTGVGEGFNRTYEPAEPRVTLALAPGTWLSAHAANILTGEPVNIDYLAAPE